MSNIANNEVAAVDSIGRSGGGGGGGDRSKYWWLQLPPEMMTSSSASQSVAHNGVGGGVGGGGSPLTPPSSFVSQSNGVAGSGVASKRVSAQAGDYFSSTAVSRQSSVSSADSGVIPRPSAIALAIAAAAAAAAAANSSSTSGSSRTAVTGTTSAAVNETDGVINSRGVGPSDVNAQQQRPQLVPSVPATNPSMTGTSSNVGHTSVTGTSSHISDTSMAITEAATATATAAAAKPSWYLERPDINTRISLQLAKLGLSDDTTSGSNNATANTTARELLQHLKTLIHSQPTTEVTDNGNPTPTTPSVKHQQSHLQPPAVTSTTTTTAAATAPITPVTPYHLVTHKRSPSATAATAVTATDNNNDSESSTMPALQTQRSHGNVNTTARVPIYSSRARRLTSASTQSSSTVSGAFHTAIAAAAAANVGNRRSIGTLHDILGDIPAHEMSMLEDMLSTIVGETSALSEPSHILPQSHVMANSSSNGSGQSRSGQEFSIHTSTFGGDSSGLDSGYQSVALPRDELTEDELQQQIAQFVDMPLPQPPSPEQQLQVQMQHLQLQHAIQQQQQHSQQQSQQHPQIMYGRGHPGASVLPPPVLRSPVNEISYHTQPLPGHAQAQLQRQHSAASSAQPSPYTRGAMYMTPPQPQLNSPSGTIPLATASIASMHPSPVVHHLPPHQQQQQQSHPSSGTLTYGSPTITHDTSLQAQQIYYQQQLLLHQQAQLDQLQAQLNLQGRHLASSIAGTDSMVSGGLSQASDHGSGNGNGSGSFNGPSGDAGYENTPISPSSILGHNGALASHGNGGSYSAPIHPQYHQLHQLQQQQQQQQQPMVSPLPAQQFSSYPWMEAHSPKPDTHQHQHQVVHISKTATPSVISRTTVGTFGGGNGTADHTPVSRAATGGGGTGVMPSFLSLSHSENESEYSWSGANGNCFVEPPLVPTAVPRVGKRRYIFNNRSKQEPDTVDVLIEMSHGSKKQKLPIYEESRLIKKNVDATSPTAASASAASAAASSAGSKRYQRVIRISSTINSLIRPATPVSPSSSSRSSLWHVILEKTGTSLAYIFECHTTTPPEDLQGGRTVRLEPSYGNTENTYGFQFGHRRYRWQSLSYHTIRANIVCTDVESGKTVATFIPASAFKRGRYGEVEIELNQVDSDEFERFLVFCARVLAIDDDMTRNAKASK